MFKRLLITFLSAVVSVSMVSCVGNSSVNYDIDLSSVTEVGVTVVSSIADDASTGDVGVSSVDVASFEDEIGTVGVDEFTCEDGWSSCVHGVRTRVTDCVNPAVNYTKDVSLSFFGPTGAVDTSCTGLGTTGNYVTKSGTEKLIIPINGDYTSTSDAQNNYNNVSIGGGAEITKRADGSVLITINGINKNHTDRNDALVWTHSVHTDPSSPLVLNQLARNGRSISSGTVIVDHNESKFTATLVFNNVTYTTSTSSTGNCCYPVSGTLSVTLSGSRTGTGTLTFSQTCGTATYSGDISGETLMMISCTSSIN